jgi:hypothetical protein
MNIRKILFFVIYVLLGISPASDCVLPTVRKHLSGPSSKAACGILHIQGRQFPSRSAVYQSLKHIPKEPYKKCYEKWVGRWQLCLDKEGDYVEK